MGINRLFNNKCSNLIPKNDLEINDLKGHVQSIESKCYRITKETEPNRTLDYIEDDNNFFMYFNYLGFISQKITYYIRYDNIIKYQIYLFQYYSNNLLRGIREYTSDKILKDKVNFKYVIKNNKLKKKNLENNRTIEEYEISENFRILPSIEYIGLPFKKGEIKYFYNEHRKILKTVNTNNHITEEYIYENNRILKVKRYHNLLSDFLEGVDHYYYDESKLKKIEYFEFNEELDRTDIFEYDINKNWTKKEIIFKKTIGYIVERNIKYYDINFPEIS
jgi:hypothetical protein